MKKYFGLALITLVGLAAPALAQQSRGDTDLQLQGSLFVGGSGKQQDSGSVSALLGRFFTDYQEVGLSVTGVFDAGAKFGGFGGPYYRYNFSKGKVVPYLGFAAGSTFGNFGGGTTTILNAEGGARFFVDRQTAFTVAASKSYILKSKEFDKSVTIQFGFSHLWGK